MEYCSNLTLWAALALQKCFLHSAHGLSGNLRSPNRCVTGITATADVTTVTDVTESMFEVGHVSMKKGPFTCFTTIAEMIVGQKSGITVSSVTETGNGLLCMGKKRMASQMLWRHLEYFAEPGFL